MRSRAWCFTINNYTDADIDFLNQVECRYLIYGKECVSTPHLQGYIYFADAKSFDALKYYFPTAHLEIAQGSPESNITYCSKEGQVYERGSRPAQGRRSDFDNIRQLMEDGNSIHDIAKLYPSQYIRYHTGMHKLAEIYDSSNELRDVNVEVLYGPTGTGKSTYVYFTNLEDPPYRVISPKYFDRYRGEKVVLLDDFRIADWDISFLLQFLDKFPLVLNIKFGTVRAKFTKVYITTNEDVMMYPAALLRRFNKVVHMDQLYKGNVSEGRGDKLDG